MIYQNDFGWGLEKGNKGSERTVKPMKEEFTMKPNELLLRRLVADGNTVIIVEHKLSLIAQADWVIDMGPEGGSNGGEVIFAGVPGDLLDCERSKTAAYLKKEI